MWFFFLAALIGGCAMTKGDVSCFHPLTPFERITLRGAFGDAVAVGLLVMLATLGLMRDHSFLTALAVGGVSAVGFGAGEFVAILAWGGEAKKTAKVFALVATDRLDLAQRLVEHRHPMLSRQVEGLSFSGIARLLHNRTTEKYRYCDGDNAVDLALRNGATQSLRLLLSAGYRSAPRRQGAFGLSSLDEAVRLGFDEVIELANTYGMSSDSE